ncbi:hypothetical protein OJAV_G00050030 [Oryzias javanicus]|uniref:Uncharacterized protein n=1 Tax=Oryzias javanicus TaxID=123683 RepID=A0A437DEL9_ORYJA|nr:hypothetical protein OJAV_G00050030 [Oryzias javanicus]
MSDSMWEQSHEPQDLPETISGPSERGGGGGGRAAPLFVLELQQQQLLFCWSLKEEVMQSDGRSPEPGSVRTGVEPPSPSTGGTAPIECDVTEFQTDAFVPISQRPLLCVCLPEEPLH